jgi:hypothetical protein
MHGSRPPLSVVTLRSRAVSVTRYRVTLRRAPHRAREVMALLDGGLLAALTVSFRQSQKGGGSPLHDGKAQACRYPCR